MNAGIPPEPGASRLTISTYRITADGRQIGRTEERSYDGDGAPDWLLDPLSWPPCRCPRCARRRTR